jgi:hypothetical protein
VQEVVRSLTRHGRNAGGEWDEEAHQATYRVWPDKESPLWDPYSPIIYWWTASEVDPEQVYRVAYNGYVLVVPKKMSMGNCAFRAVRRVPPNRGEKGGERDFSPSLGKGEGVVTLRTWAGSRLMIQANQ